MSETDRALSALQAIDPGCPRDEWFTVACAAQAAGVDVGDFDKWSEGGGNYTGERDVQSMWRSITPGGGINAGTLFERARAAGWRDERTNGHAKPEAPQPRQKAAKGLQFDPAAVWATSEPATPQHGYISRKLGLSDGLKKIPDDSQLWIAGDRIAGYLLVPAYNVDGELQSWQAIPPAPGQRKLNAPRASVVGASFTVGGSVGEIAFLCEGIGQAWSAHQASGKPAVCCFGAHNVERIAKQLHERHPAAQLVVVADRGKETESEAMARDVSGAWVQLPEGWPQNADLNDVHVRDGQDAVRTILADLKRPEVVAKDEPVEIDLSSLAATEPHPPVFIVPDWLPAGEITLHAAHGGTGKSLFELHLGVCLALGREFHGLPVEQRGVDLVSFEDPEAVIHWRLHRICQALGVPIDSLVGRLRVFDGTTCATSWYGRGEYGQAGPTVAFHDIAKRIGGPGRVVIVDGASDTFAGNENDRAQVKAFIRTLRRLIAPDGALVLIAHVDKGSANSGEDSLGFSGSTGWHNGVRCRWFMYRETESDNVIVEVRKSNLGPMGARMTLRFDEATGLFQRIDEVRGRPLQRADEADAIVEIIRDAYANGDPIPSSATGQRTAHSVCDARDDLPASLKGRSGRRRFYKALEQLRACGAVRVEPFRRPNRHMSEVLNARD